MRGMLIGETALSPMPCPTSLTSNSEMAGSQQGLALQRVYVIDDGQRFVANKQHRSILQSLKHVAKFVDAAKVNLRKHRSAVWRSAVPNLGVTCPPFFRCEAPRFYISPYSSANVPHALTTSGDCHAR